MSNRSTTFLPATMLLLSMALGALAPAAAHAQVQLNGVAYTSGGALGVTLLPGTTSAVTGSAGANTLTSTFTGDVVTSLIGSTGAGVYPGSVLQSSVVQFTIGALPVRIGEASMHANFKIVASGGNGVTGGNDPVVTATVLGRLYQQLGAAPVPASDPWLSAIEFSHTYTQNGNGLQVIDATYGPGTSNYIMTPGNFYLYQQIFINTSYTSNGVIQPLRGMTIEYGGGLSAGYSGLEYTFGWQTVPTPGAAALAGFGGLVALRRRRR